MPTLNDLSATVDDLREQVSELSAATQLNTQAIQHHAQRSSDQHAELIARFTKLETHIFANEALDREEVRVPRKLMLGLIGFLILTALVGGKAAVEAVERGINPFAPAAASSPTELIEAVP